MPQMLSRNLMPCHKKKSFILYQTTVHATIQLLSMFGGVWPIADNHLYAACICLLSTFKCSLHRVSFGIFTQEQNGINLHSLTVAISVRLETDFHWEDSTIVVSHTRLGSFSDHCSAAAVHGHTWYGISFLIDTFNSLLQLIKKLGDFNHYAIMGKPNHDNTFTFLCHIHAIYPF